MAHAGAFRAALQVLRGLVSRRPTSTWGNDALVLSSEPTQEHAHGVPLLADLSRRNKFHAPAARFFLLCVAWLGIGFVGRGVVDRWSIQRAPRSRPTRATRHPQQLVWVCRRRLSISSLARHTPAHAPRLLILLLASPPACPLLARMPLASRSIGAAAGANWDARGRERLRAGGVAAISTSSLVDEPSPPGRPSLCTFFLICPPRSPRRRCHGATAARGRGGIEGINRGRGVNGPQARGG